MLIFPIDNHLYVLNRNFELENKDNLNGLGIPLVSFVEVSTLIIINYLICITSSNYILNEKYFFDLISTRHSVRAFKDRSISEEKINAIMSASLRGPSAGNLQAYQIFIVSNLAEKEKLAESAHGQKYVSEAPLVMVFCAEPKRSSSEYGSRGEELFCIQDATIACVYSQLAAHSLGLSSVWIGSFDEEKVSKTLNLEKNLKPIAILPIGFSNEIPEITGRRPLGQIIHKI